MVPHEGGNIGLGEERSDRRSAGVECQLRSSSKVKHSFFGIRRRRLGVDERPAAVKNGGPELRRDVQRRQIRRAKSCNEKDKLEVGHFGVLNIKRWHTRPL